jgi:peptide/nickel transport system substrate-binding protein
MKLFPGIAVLLSGAGLTALLLGWPGGGASRPPASAQEPGGAERFGPGPEPVDRWHPRRDAPAEPAFGGTLTVHLEALPPSLNHALLNSQYTRNALFELHAFLVQRGWESWEFEPELATSWEVADTVLRKDGSVLHGRVREQEGKLWVEAEPGSPAGDDASLALEQDQVERVERGTVFTFHLRPGVRWHDGHPFDAEDVLFSWRIAANPSVRCDWVRPSLRKIVRAEALDPLTVRFVFGEQYFNSLGFLADDLCVLPRHLYDLRDPDHARHDARAGDEACAKEINENPCNTQWIGLGPYRLTSYSPQGIQAERFEAFFDPERSGYVDRIVWRHIASDEAAFQALLNGELDFSTRLSSEQYFGPATQQEAFTRRFCKGYFYLGAFNYVPWNMRRPILSDLDVRKALAHTMDLEAYVETVAHGLAVLPTGPQCYFGPAYDRDVERLAYDPERARALFAAAGWYDRDGDGVLDKDGKPFELEMLVMSGNVAAEVFGRMFQESLAKVGARLRLTPVDQATYFKRVNERDFDCGQAAWTVDATENDPVQLWHSSSAVKGGSNHAGVMDPEVDRLIAKGNRELDAQGRHQTWRELHRYLYENVQPYLYREAPPRKFALSLGLRGAQFFKISPGYSLRRWYYPAGTPGTRAGRGKG